MMSEILGMKNLTEEQQEKLTLMSEASGEDKVLEQIRVYRQQIGCAFGKAVDDLFDVM